MPNLLHHRYLPKSDALADEDMNEEFNGLEAKVNQLIALCAHLHAENQRLIAECRASRDEKSRLYKKNREASRQIDEIIDELRAVIQ